MQTRTALRHFTGRDFQWGDGPLSQVADQLLEAFQVREANRLDEAETRASMMGTAPMLAALRRRFAEAEAQDLIDNAAPLIMRYDAQQLLFDASRELPDDRGLKMAAAHAKELWMKDPDGVLAVGDVARLRAHWMTQFPKSKLASVIDQELPKAGFNTLPVAKLAQIATHIRGENEDELLTSYETVVRAHGLEGDRPEQIRARAYLRGLVHLASEPLPTVDSSSAEVGGTAAADRTLSRMAAFDDPILRMVGQMGAPPPEGDVDMGVAELAPHELEVPHAEEPGSIVEVQSPITGEPLALELELAEGEGEAEPLPDVTPDDVDGLQLFGQLDAFNDGASDDGVPAVNEGPGEIQTTIEDPSAPGEMLSVTVKPVGSESGEGAEAINPLDVPMETSAGRRSFAVYAIRGGMKAAEPLERFAAESMPRALAHVAQSLGELGATGVVKSKPEYFASKALVVLDAAAGNHLYVVAENAEQTSERTVAATPESVDNHQVAQAARQAVRQTPPQAMTKEAVGAVCAEKLQLTAANVEELLLAAEPAVVMHDGRVAWKLEVDDSTDVVLSRGTTIVKKTAFAEMDSAIEDFLARCATVAGGSAQVVASKPVAGYEIHPLFIVGCAQCGSMHEYLMPKEASAVRCECGFETSAQGVALQMQSRQAQAVPGYVIMTDVPGAEDERTVNARRLLAAIQQIAPQAKGVINAGRLEVSVRPLDDGGLARIRNVLESKFGARPETKVARTNKAAQGGPTQQNMQTVIPPSLAVQNSGAIQPTYTPPGSRAPQSNAPAMPTIVMPSAPGQPEDPAQPDQKTIATTASSAPLWSITYRGFDGAPVSLQVEAASADAARRIFAAYDADSEILGVTPGRAAPLERRGQAMPPPPTVPMADPAGGPSPEMASAPSPSPAPMPDMNGGGSGDVGGGTITPQIKEAIAAAMLTLRNTGIDVASAISEFQSQFKELLLKFGDKQAPARQELAAEIVRAATEAWAKPTLIEVTGARQAAMVTVGALLKEALGKMKVPALGTRGPAVKLPGAGKLLGPDSSGDDPKVMNPKVKTQVKPRGKMSPTDMSGGDGEHSVDPGSFGAAKPPKDGSYGKPGGKGQSFSKTDLGPDSQNRENPTTRSWDSVSSGAGKRRRAAVASLAKLTFAGQPADDAQYWLSEAARVAKSGSFPEDELWAARDAGIERVRFQGRVAEIVRDALNALGAE